MNRIPLYLAIGFGVVFLTAFLVNFAFNFNISVQFFFVVSSISLGVYFLIIALLYKLDKIDPVKWRGYAPLLSPLGTVFYALGFIFGGVSKGLENVYGKEVVFGMEPLTWWGFFWLVGIILEYRARKRIERERKRRASIQHSPL
jgi:hypothetical protein